MDITAVFEGLAAAAGAIDGLRSFGYLPDAIAPPTFYVVEAEIQFDQAFARGMDDINPVTCRLLASRATDRGGQRQLQAYMAGSGPRSVKAALEADRTLGGVCEAVHVTGVRGMGQYEHGGVAYVGADFMVRVIGRGD